MFRTGTLALGLFLVFALSAISQEHDLGQLDSGVLRSPVSGLGPSFDSTPTVIAHILRSAKAPGGIVSMSLCNSTQKFDFAIPSGSSLGTALRAITHTDPTFRWQIEDGVVYARPASAHAILLDTRIANFKVNPKEPVEAAIDRVLRETEVGASITRLKMNRGPMRLGMQAIKPEGAADHAASPAVEIITLKNRRLYEVLNSIARVHGSAVWLYREDVCSGTKTFYLDVIAK